MARYKLTLCDDEVVYAHLADHEVAMIGHNSSHLITLDNGEVIDVVAIDSFQKSNSKNGF